MAALGASSSSVTARAFGTSAMRSATEGQKESIASFMSKFEAVKPSTMDLPNTPSDFIKPRGEVPATTPSKLTLNFFMPHEIQFDGEEVEQVQVPATTGDMGVLPGHVPTVVQMRPGVVAVTVSEKEVQKVRTNPPNPSFATSPRVHGADSGVDASRGNPMLFFPASLSVDSAREQFWSHPWIVTPREERARGAAASPHLPSTSDPRPVHLPRSRDPRPPTPPGTPRMQFFVSSGFAFIHADSTTDICAVEAVPVEQLDGEAVKKGLADYQAKLQNAKDDYEKASAQIGIEVCGAMNSALGN